MEAPCKKSSKGLLSTPSSNLPSLILTEILCRLPIKTLATCKSVCKSWLHLIRDPQFWQLHQAIAPTEIFLQFYRDQTTSNLHMGNFHFLNNFNPLDVNLNTWFEFPNVSAVNYDARNASYVFANSCNGLLSYYGNLTHKRFAAIWNPFTAEFIKFPAPYIDKKVFTCRGYGLGFSRKANRYKLLRVIERNESWTSDDRFVGEICTIEKACSWKTVGPLPFSKDKFIQKLFGTFMQGAIHWLCSSSHSCTSKIDILTFDFEDDQFGRLLLPTYYAKTDTIVLHGELGVLAGCLFITEYTDQDVTIWLMKEYGVQDSWTKLFCVGFIIDSRLYYRNCVPITYMDNGEILMRSSSNVFFYNPDLKIVRGIGSVDCSNYLRAIACRPSLVMLKDSMPGYHLHVKSRYAHLGHTEMSATPKWWAPVKESPQYDGSKVHVRTVELPVAALREKREEHVSATSEFSTPESLAAMLAYQQGTEAPATSTGGESHGHIRGKKLVQISTSVMSAQGTSADKLARGQGSKTPLTDGTCVSAMREDPLERIKTVMEEVLEELRKEREQRQELEERLRNELANVEPLDEQAEQLKQYNKQLKERLQDEHAKVKQLEKQIHDSEQLEQENGQMVVQMMDEIKAHFMGSH